MKQSYTGKFLKPVLKKGQPGKTRGKQKDLLSQAN